MASTSPRKVFQASDEDDGDENGETSHQGMVGMADIINKILQKNIPSEKGIILSKNKSAKKRKLENEEKRLEEKDTARKKREFEELNHVKPSGSNADKEVALRRMATRGVVQLFNAVSKHQKELESKIRDVKGERKKDKVIDSVSKSSFLDLLKGESTVQDNMKQIKKKVDGQPGWNILRDDFMMGAKMKDWDKEENSSGQSDDNSSFSSEEQRNSESSDNES